METKITLTYDQWEKVLSLVSDERDSMARALAGSVVQKDEQDVLDRLAKKYAFLESIYNATLRSEDV